MDSLRPLIADDFENLLREYINSMPTFSPASAKIIQLANMLNPPANEIVSSIRLDPVLTGKVLQLANSAYFSLAQRVTSLNRALVYLGINTIKNLALSTAIMEAFETRNKELKEIVKPTWSHSLATAICAKGLAKLAGVSPLVIEEYFIMGLLHDLGKITMIQAFYRHLPHYGELSLEEEMKMYQLRHDSVGASILKKWKFSDDIVEAIQNHHQPKSEHQQTNLLHLANALTYELHLNGKADPSKDRVHAIHENAWNVIKVKKDDAIKELASAQEQIQKAEVFLNIATSKDIVKETP